MNAKRIQIKKLSRCLAFFLIAGGVSFFSTPALATTNNVIRECNNWPTTWIPLNALDDGYEGKAHIDFVGNASNHCGFYAFTNDYVFFRQRVHTNTTDDSVFDNAFFVVINLIGTNYGAGVGEDGYPDYTFAWDSVNRTDVTQHGLEMQIRAVGSVSTWSAIKFNDIDGDNPNFKRVEDINYETRTDGCVRVISEQSTIDFGVTTFIDYAVKWSYLQTYTGLNSNQTWKVTFASNIVSKNSTDHEFLNGDIAGGAELTSDPTTTGWATVMTTPTGSATPPQGTYFSFK
jgi:hypothetical protein